MADPLIQITDKQTGLPIGDKPLDLDAAKAKLAATNGQTYWRSLEELAETPGFTQMLQREFPGQAPKDWAPLARRDFVKLMGAALALAGLSGCAFQPQEKIVPYVERPEALTAGIPLFYATAMNWMGFSLGLMAESHMGRPTKLDGNPDHPSTLGRASIFAQAEILNMYDPDRSQSVRYKGSPTNWDNFVGTAARLMDAAKADGGAGVAFLTEAVTSPSLAAQMALVRRALPNAKWHSFEPINRDSSRAGVRLAFGQDVHPVYHFDRANVIVSLDSDFLAEEPASIRYARDFIQKRQVRNGQTTMSRLYVFESTPSITGAQADHRVPMKASQVDGFARALAAAVGIPGVSGEASGDLAKWATAIAKDLGANRGRALVVAGLNQPPAVHALAHAITAQLGGAGAQGVVSYHQPVEANPRLHGEAIRELTREMNAGRVKTLVVMDANPVYNAPADLEFGKAMGKVPNRIHYGISENETSVLCQWHVPAAHFLEAWGDGRSFDGTISIQQPLIMPLYEACKAPVEFLGVFAGLGTITSYDVVRGYWLRQRGAGTDDLKFQKFWQKTVHDGFIPGTSSALINVGLRNNLTALPAATSAIGGLEINFRPDPTIWDGRYANNAWLQECPKPVSKTVWDNAAFIAPETAERLKLNTNDRVSLTVNGRSVETGVYLLPGQPADTITLHMGYGRERVGKIGTGTGADANASKLRTSESPFFVAGEIKATGGNYRIATTSYHNLIALEGKETTWADTLTSDDAKTKIVDKFVAPGTAEVDIDGTHGRDVIRVGNFNEWKRHLNGAKDAEIPVHPEKDRIGVPLAYPNPPKLRDSRFGEGRESHDTGSAGEGSGHAGETHERPLANNRELAGQPSFYPRNADPLGVTTYRDPAVQAAHEKEMAAKGRDNATQQWGMAVDLQSCIGCNACVVGCQSENNTSTVGKDQVLMGREMHWMRIDLYQRGSLENPEIYFEPMFCQHCEKAPCAPVCPFNAVMVSPDGVNEQIYNRCVGTKYCENNCPYKVRRFNFLQYADQQTPVIQLMQNPDVTVRSRGVMEKCTYCIQRVNYAKIQAEKEGRLVADGEIVTACQQTCPTDALVFGDINDPNSRVSKLKRGDLNFGILTDHNTMPRTTYLARMKNPNPEITWDKPALMAGMKE